MRWLPVALVVLGAVPALEEWLAGTSVIAATPRADQPTLLLIRVPEGAR